MLISGVRSDQGPKRQTNSVPVTTTEAVCSVTPNSRAGRR